jgi:hypothetical protein
MTSKTDVPNKIKQSCLCCVYCGKSYKTRLNLDKHLVLCETIHRSKNTKIKPNQHVVELEDSELPSQRQMYNIILELTLKCNKLEEKLEQMTKWVEKKKKKINIIEWLNTNINPEFIFDELINRLSLNDSDIDLLLTNGFNEAFCQFASRNIFEKKEQLKFPLFCLDQKTNCIYVYNKQNSVGEPLWYELEKDKLIYFMNKIHMMIAKGLTDWKKNLEKEKRFNEGHMDLYNKTLIKVMDIDFKKESTLNKIKNIIYEAMKTDMKGLIEYDFEG